MSSNKSIWNKGVNLMLDEELNDHNISRLFSLFSCLAMNRFKWKNLPNEISSRKIEKYLYEYGQVLFFDDSSYGLLCLPCSPSSGFNVYGSPLAFHVHGIGYDKDVKREDGIRIKSNDNCFPMKHHMLYYATKIAKCDKAIDVNVTQQKFPYIVGTTKQNELTMRNIMDKVEKDELTIYVDEKLNMGGELGIEVAQLNAPFVADKLQQHKNNLMCELLTLLGLNNTASNNMKKERLLVDEVNVNNDEIKMYLDMELKCREVACEKINKKYGLNISVEKVQKDIEPNILGVEEQKGLGGEGLNG